MKVCYFNDERKDIVAQVQSLGPNGDVKNEYVTIPARTLKVIEFNAPDGAIPYIKRWETRQFLIGYLPKESELLSHRSEPNGSSGDEA